jgi:hypothetical protein
MLGQPHLLEIADAFYGVRLGFDLAKAKSISQDRDDGNHDQQFDQRKRGMTFRSSPDH